MRILPLPETETPPTPDRGLGALTTDKGNLPLDSVDITFDLDRDMKFLDEKIGYVDAVNPDLSKFKSSGGKLLIMTGFRSSRISIIQMRRSA